MLFYYNHQLGMDTVEIDVSYYTLISQRAVTSWVNKTTDDFTFAVKCHKEMTFNEMGRINPIEVDNKALFNKFLETFRPMIQSGKLLTFLAQFGPVFFKNQEGKDYLLRFRERFGTLPLTVEFRHKSWLGGQEMEDTFKFLEQNNLGYAIVDEPRLRSLAPFITRATNDVGYFRLHGRNKKWFGGDRDTRYDYFYSDEELNEFISPIRMIAEMTRITPVFFNNCHAGAAYANALRLIKQLGLKHVENPGGPDKPMYRGENSHNREQLEFPF